ncbi:MAG TPA: polysaccharide deacetylase family protein [Puia sp.]|jgi:peptidoglycan/xylan/chitin deacetylase (PgdA/CDA1 family)|nr:polysaccharide deacetylase family protein [Puia sp.]
MFYLVRMPWWLKKIYDPASSLIWRMPVNKEKILYLTFDDGPHPVITPWVLEVLRKHDARATFFCIGKNVKGYPEILRSTLMAGHRVGNHSYDHLNGWKTEDGKYLENIRAAAQLIDSDLYRPPYGRIRRFQAMLLGRGAVPYRIIMWDVLSGDFDKRLSGTRCAHNVIRYARPGSIIVFHDSEKAFDRLREALPMVLEHLSRLGYRFESIR